MGEENLVWKPVGPPVDEAGRKRYLKAITPIVPANDLDTRTSLPSLVGGGVGDKGQMDFWWVYPVAGQDGGVSVTICGCRN